MELRVLRYFLPAELVDMSKYEFNRIPCRERWGLLTWEDPPWPGGTLSPLTIWRSSRC